MGNMFGKTGLKRKDAAKGEQTGAGAFFYVFSRSALALALALALDLDLDLDLDLALTSAFTLILTLVPLSLSLTDIFPTILASIEGNHTLSAGRKTGKSNQRTKARIGGMSALEKTRERMKKRKLCSSDRKEGGGDSGLRRKRKEGIAKK